MQQKDHIERIIESGKTIHPAEPNPYLFNKVLEKFKGKVVEMEQTRPVLVWASVSVLTLFIAVNIYMLSYGTTSTSNSDLNSVVAYYGMTNQGGLNYE